MGGTKHSTRARVLALFSFALALASIALLPDRASAASGWQIVLDRPTPNFGAVDFVSDSEGWMPAGAGLLHTTDGGATWTENAKLAVNDVDFFDQQHGWAVGLSGAIYGTSDGGHRWQLQTSGTSVHLSNVVAVGQSEAWAVGTGEGFSDVIMPPPTPSALLHTTNGGSSWQSIPAQPNGTYREVAAVGSHVWVLADRCELQPDYPYCAYDPPATTFIQHSADGGAAWETLEVPDRNVFRLMFANENDGWLTSSACGFPDCIPTTSVHRTVDGGVTWQSFDTSAYGTIQSLSFEEAQHGWALAVSCRGGDCIDNLLYTDNGGATWYQQSTEERSRSRYAESLVAHHGALYLTAQSGEASRSLDRGRSWEPMATDAVELWDVAPAGPNVAYAGGRNDIIRTDDGGATWRPVASIGGNVRLLGFTDETHGVAVSWDCDYGCIRLYQTNDGGTSWQLLHELSTDRSTYPISLQLADAQHGLLALEGTLFSTSDGGESWNERRLQEAESVSNAGLTDASHAWAIVNVYEDYPGEVQLRTSEDGGHTWETVPLEQAPSKSVSFTDAEHGWYLSAVCEITCTNTLLSTSNGGITWQPISDFEQDYLSYLTFVDEHHGWAVGASYDEAAAHTAILHSIDGGRTWEAQLTSEEPLAGYALANGFDFADAGNGWFLLDPLRNKGIGGGPPSRTIVYHLGGDEIVLPDVGTDVAGHTNSPLLLILLAAAGWLALAASHALRRGHM